MKIPGADGGSTDTTSTSTGGLRADKIAGGQAPGQEAISHVISVSEEGGQTRITWHAGEIRVFVKTEAALLERLQFEPKEGKESVTETAYGYDILGAANPEAEANGAYDGVLIGGDVEAIAITQKNGQPAHLFVNNALVSEGVNLSWPASANFNPSGYRASGAAGLLDMVPGLLPGVGPLNSSQTTAAAILVALAVGGTVIG